MKRLALAAVLALVALPALAQQRPDPAEQAVVGSVQMLIERYEQSQRELAMAQAALACWEKTGKACPPPIPPSAKP